MISPCCGPEKRHFLDLIDLMRWPLSLDMATREHPKNFIKGYVQTCVTRKPAEARIL
jgi:hypothetical protein